MNDRYYKVLTGTHKGAKVAATFTTYKALKKGLQQFSPNIGLFVRSCRRKKARHYGGYVPGEARNKRLKTVKITPAIVTYLKPGDFKL